MNVNPLASMQCWEVELELGGRVYTIPALPALGWWPILIELDLMAILDLTDTSELDEPLISGEVTYAQLGEALKDALESVAGRSLHVAYVLAVTADQHWMNVNGDLARRGFRWDEMPLAAALDAIYVTVVSAFQKQEDLDKFLRLLKDESSTSSGGKRTASQEVKDEFESMAGPRPTSGVRSTGEQSGNARSRTRTQPRPRPRGGPSGGPRQRPSTRAGSGPRASSVSPVAGDEPASGTGPPPRL